MGLYVPSERGRSRSRGPSGGGTLCSGEPQLLQCSGPPAPARSQWPRPGHSGLMHWTVQPGRYCTLPPRRFRTSRRRRKSRADCRAACLWCQVESYYLLWPCSTREYPAHPETSESRDTCPLEGRGIEQKAEREVLSVSGHGSRAARAALRPRGLGWSLAHKLGSHDAGDKFLHAVRVEIDGGAVGIGFGNDAEAVDSMLDVLPCGENLHRYLLRRRSEILEGVIREGESDRVLRTGLAQCLARGW